MSTATSGRAREHRVRNHLAAHGWRQVMRSAGSKGSADLLVAHAVHGAALVQVGTRNKALGPADRARFVADADDCGALALLAVVIPGKGVTYWQVNVGTPRTWQLWEPGPDAEPYVTDGFVTTRRVDDVDGAEASGL